MLHLRCLRSLSSLLPLLASCVSPGGGADGTAPDAPDTSVSPAVTAQVRTIASDHRYIPGAMFGGWGPHLGHLVELGDAGARALTWIDDHCVPTTPGDCDVNVNRRLSITRREAGTWRRLRQVPLPPTVQQNTATIADGGRAWTFGIDVVGRRVVECRHDLASSTCAPIPIDVGAGGNYVGAAVTPAGWRLVWWTNVRDGGGGTFSYIIDYGGGWNGPRTGGIGGYNDCAYAHVGFSPGSDQATFVCQVVAGLAPSWTYGVLVGQVGLASGAPVTWSVALPPPASDPLVSTNDLWIDPRTGDGHLLARTAASAAVYYHRPAGGNWRLARSWPASFRARWLVTEDAVTLLLGPATGGLQAWTTPRASVVAGQALALADDGTIAVPGGQVYGIYPLAPAYQRITPSERSAVVVGSQAQASAVAVELGP